MKNCLPFVALAVASLAFQAVAAEPAVVLPKVIVSAPPEVKFFTISWETKGPLPFAKIKRAWFSEVVAGGAAEAAGIKIGDELIRIAGVAVAELSGSGLKQNLKQERVFGSREEVVFRTGQGELKTVVFVYDRPAKTPKAPEPAR